MKKKTKQINKQWSETNTRWKQLKKEEKEERREEKITVVAKVKEKVEFVTNWKQKKLNKSYKGFSKTRHIELMLK